MTGYAMHQPVSSFADRLRAEAAARKARLYGAPKIVNLASQPIAATQVKGANTPVQMTAPKPRCQHDEHMRIWRWIKNDKDRRWLTVKCAEHEVCVFDMVSSSRQRKLTDLRMTLYMLARHEQGMSNSAIARLFGDRDHTTILAGIRKAELQRFGKTSEVDKRRRTTRVTDEEAKEIGAAYLGGMPIMEIRGTFHICARTLYRLAKLHGWRRPQIR